MRRQQDEEPVETFITDLYALAEHCGYGDLHDEMIRDHINVGIRNTTLSEKLQLEADLTLDRALTQARQSEAVKQQQPLLRTGSEAKGDTPVGAVHKGRPTHRPGIPDRALEPLQFRGLDAAQSATGAATTLFMIACIIKLEMSLFGSAARKATIPRCARQQV